MRTVPALIAAWSVLGVLSAIASQKSQPSTAPLSGPILGTFQNQLMVAGPKGVVPLGTGSAVMRVDDRIEPRFRGVYTVTASEWSPEATDPLEPREVVLHLPAALRPQFGRILKETQQAQCRNNVVRLERSRQAWLQQHPNTKTAPTLLEVTELTAGLHRARCSAGGRYVVNSRTVSSRCSLPEHAMAGSARPGDLLAALPDLPPLDKKQQSLQGTVYGDPLDAPVFVLLTPARAYLISQQQDARITLRTDAAAAADEWSARLTGAVKGPVFEATGIVLGVSPGGRAPAEARITARTRDRCRAGLRQLEAAAEQWALDHPKAATHRPTIKGLLGPGRYLQRLPKCPAGGTYRLRTLEEGPTCSVKGHTLQTD